MRNVKTTQPIWVSDNTKFILALILTAVIVYGFPALGIPLIIRNIIFLVWLLFVYKSKKDVFWLVWYFVLINAPGRLFSATAGDVAQRLPIYSVMPGVSLGFTDLFVIMYIVKYLVHRANHKYVFKKHFVWITLYALIMLLYSIFWGISFTNLISSIRMIVPLTLIFIIPAFINSEEKVDHAFRLLFPIVFVALATVIHAQIRGAYLHDLLSGVTESYRLVGVEERLIRVTHAFFVVFICIIQSLYYLYNKVSRFNRTYLILVIISGILTIFLSATRGWVVALAVLFVSLFYVSSRRFVSIIIKTIVLFAMFIFILSMLFPFLPFQAVLAYERVMTLEELAAGDLTAGGTLGRIATRSPRVMSKFWENPLLGWGFSNVFFNWSDGHVGNQNMLLHGGIIGYLIWMSVYISICLIIIKGNRPLRRFTGDNSFLVYLFAMLASFVIHSSSAQLWGFRGGAGGVYNYWALLFAAINVALISKGNRNAITSENASSSNNYIQ